jgi:hypothetical protein
VPAGSASAPTGAKAQDIPIGTKGEAGKGAETLKDLEILQRQAYFAEMRAKVKDAEKPAIPAAASASAPLPSFPGSVAPAMVPALPQAPQAGSSSPSGMQPQYGSGFMSLPGAAPNLEPTSRLVNLIISGGRARADVHTNGIVNTIREGDKLEGDWVVTKIALSGVTVEKVVTQEPPITGRLSASPAAGPAMVASAATRRGAKKSPVGVAHATPFLSKSDAVERSVTAQLKPYTAGSQQYNASPVAGTGSTMGAAVIPPLPSAMRPVDSTNVPPAAALNPPTHPPMSAAMAYPPIAGPAGYALPMSGR